MQPQAPLHGMTNSVLTREPYSDDVFKSQLAILVVTVVIHISLTHICSNLLFNYYAALIYC